MELNLKTIKKEFLEDKRISERLSLPIHLSYSFEDLPLDVSSSCWKAPIMVDNIGGSGAQFKTKDPIKKENTLSLKLYIPNDPKVIMFTADIVWIKNNQSKLRSEKTYDIGIRFHKMQHHDRQRFVRYLSDHILLQHLDAQGNMLF